jgi:hypothetical protein
MKVDISGAKVKISRLKQMPPLMRKKLTFWASDTLYHIKRNISGRILHVGTGQLSRNTGMKLVEFGQDNFGVVLGTGPDVGLSEVKYASIQEHGGTIKPLRAKWLTIPVGGTKGKAANYPDSFFIKSKSGNLLLVERRGKRGGLHPLFVLKKEVKIPASHWLSDSIAEKIAELNAAFDPNALVGELLSGGRGSGIED